MNYRLTKTSDPLVLAGFIELPNRVPAPITVYKAEPLEQSQVVVSIPERDETLSMTLAQMDRVLRRRDTGELIQDILPEMAPRDREYFVTGTPMPV